MCIHIWYVPYAYSINKRVVQNRDNKIATSAKLRDIVYKSYGFSTDLIETIN